MNLIVKTTNGLFDLSKQDWIYIEEDQKTGMWYLMASCGSESACLQEYKHEKGARWGIGETFLALRTGSRGVDIIPKYKPEDLERPN